MLSKAKSACGGLLLQNKHHIERTPKACHLYLTPVFQPGIPPHPKNYETNPILRQARREAGFPPVFHGLALPPAGKAGAGAGFQGDSESSRNGNHSADGGVEEWRRRWFATRRRRLRRPGKGVRPGRSRIDRGLAGNCSKFAGLRNEPNRALSEAQRPFPGDFP